jgi:hypothetical protein
MQSAHELTTRWPALDIAAKRARLANSLHLSPGLADASSGSIAAAERAASGLWRADPSVWSADAALQQEIGKWRLQPDQNISSVVSGFSRTGISFGRVRL